MPKDALQKRYLRFPSKHLPKNCIFKHSTFYTKNTIKRENILPLLPNSLNLLLVSFWGKLISSWASSTSASTSSWSWFSASISSWSWSPSRKLSNTQVPNAESREHVRGSCVGQSFYRKVSKLNISNLCMFKWSLIFFKTQFWFRQII